MEIVVAERTRFDMDKIKHVVQPDCPVNDSFPQRIFYLYKTYDHNDPLLINGEYSNYGSLFYIEGHVDQQPSVAMHLSVVL